MPARTSNAPKPRQGGAIGCVAGQHGLRKIVLGVQGDDHADFIQGESGQPPFLACMWFSRKQVAKETPAGSQTGAAAQPGQITTKRRGDAAESQALNHLLRAGMTLVQANYRTPGRGGGEVDLVMRDSDGTLVFVEVRQRKGSLHGGAAASISAVKQRRIIFAARHFLLRFASLPPCRFDVVTVQGSLDAPESAVIEWLRAAFDDH